MKKRTTLFFITLLYPAMAAAQILNLATRGDLASLSLNFFLSLGNCEDYEQSINTEDSGVSATTVYRVKKTDNNHCKLEVEAKTSIGVRITQNCDFDKDKAYEYADALYQFQSKKYNTRRYMEYALQDEDYLRAADIMSNEKYCNFLRDEIDNTKGLRKSLANCEAIKNIETTGNLWIIREIEGIKDDKCAFNLTIRKAHKIGDEPKQGGLKYFCLFDESLKKEYLSVLESMVIPAEKGYNFTSVQRFGSKDELSFIGEHCRMGK